MEGSNFESRRYGAFLSRQLKGLSKLCLLGVQSKEVLGSITKHVVTPLHAFEEVKEVVLQHAERSELKEEEQQLPEYKLDTVLTGSGCPQYQCYDDYEPLQDTNSSLAVGGCCQEAWVGST